MASSEHTLLSDVHLPSDSTFITSEVGKGGLTVLAGGLKQLLTKTGVVF